MKTAIGILLAFIAPAALLLAHPPGQPPDPPVSINLKHRAAQAIPYRQGFSHTGGGNIDVVQPSPDSVIVTLTAVAVAGAHPCQHSTASMTFALDQCFEIVFDNPNIQRANLSLEGKVIGLLRSHKGGGSAEQGPAHAAVSSGPTSLVALSLPAYCVSRGENLSVNDRYGPQTVRLASGQYHLQQSFTVSANHPCNLIPCKAASSEFAPDPALDPLWISYWEPFHGANKRDFGFQLVMRVSPE